MLPFQDWEWDAAHPIPVSKPIPRLSELRLSGSETGIPLFPIYDHDYGNNITPITLRDIVAKEEEVVAFVGRFEGLQLFRYFGIDLWLPEDTTDIFPPTTELLPATSIMKAPKPHAETLKTFCYDAELEGSSGWEMFEDFVNFLKDNALARLPSSLKRLHIGGYTTPLLPALSKLAALRRNKGAIPNLEEVAFKFSRWKSRWELSWESRWEPSSEDCWEYNPESRWDADARLLAPGVLDDFQKLGVRGLDRVNQLPGSWK